MIILTILFIVTILFSAVAYSESRAKKIALAKSRRY